MCAEGKRIESKLVCSTESKQNDQKITISSSPADLECEPRGLIAENNNVGKTIRQKIYEVIYDIKSVVTCEQGRVVLSRKFILVSGNL